MKQLLSRSNLGIFQGKNITILRCSYFSRQKYRTGCEVGDSWGLEKSCMTSNIEHMKSTSVYSPLNKRLPCRYALSGYHEGEGSSQEGLIYSLCRLWCLSGRRKNTIHRVATMAIAAANWVLVMI